MARDLDFPIELRFCPTVREADGLAMSSRNSYLTDEQRQQAPVVYASLQLAGQLIKRGERDVMDIVRQMTSLIGSRSHGVVDYIEIRDAADLSPLTTIDRAAVMALAVNFGTTRLIDNVVVDVDGR
jgi:pantoate--beta-alanine ligase